MEATSTNLRVLASLKRKSLESQHASIRASLERDRTRLAELLLGLLPEEAGTQDWALLALQNGQDFRLARKIGSLRKAIAEAEKKLLQVEAEVRHALMAEQALDP